MASDFVSVSTPTTANAYSSLAPVNNHWRNHNYLLHDEQDYTIATRTSQSSASKSSSSGSSVHCNATTHQDAGPVSQWRCLMFLSTIWNIFAQFCTQFNSNNIAQPPHISMSTVPDDIPFNTAPQPQSLPVLENREQLNPHAPLETVGHSIAPATVRHPIALLNGRPLPNNQWEVVSSWALADPARRPIPRSFEGHPRGRSELLHVQLYQSLVEEKHLVLSEKLFAAERLWNRRRIEEASLRLTVESKRTTPATSLLLDSARALSISEATRRSVHAYKQVCEARLAQGQLMVQRLVDALEEATNMLEDADQQMFPILNSFLQLGWPPNEIPKYNVDSAVFHIHKLHCSY
ncbi:hypothetical protein BJ165DRAFT_1410672 [Panaeolus papilionaceus]|nr:hypothetical protein BJ165DRAFT_1410672 [Panaeolus papilionaceus]